MKLTRRNDFSEVSYRVLVASERFDKGLLSEGDASLMDEFLAGKEETSVISSLTSSTYLVRRNFHEK